ncbi:helix-turn-helix domain-containing protein [Anaerosinus massiliensis]|uniref:helix-turn-helix domain-containing protein n=1 Tax=Massilibacillus massiliensis TaxID=1806837 RepID=UPI000DA60144|nr:helix-turn-helix transcriptional regulator [Massilibacillus massiliensis]
MIDESFGKVLKSLRVRKGISQEEFSFNTGLHRTYISQLERGLKSPSLRTIAKICKELEFTISQFMEEVEKYHDV